VIRTEIPSEKPSGFKLSGGHLAFAQRLPADPRTAKRQECFVDVGPFVVPDAQTAELIQPSNRPLERPSATAQSALPFLVRRIANSGKM
jgi:hypothetical protein